MGPRHEPVVEPSRPHPTTPTLVLAESATARIPILADGSERVPTLRRSNTLNVRVEKNKLLLHTESANNMSPS